MSCGAGSGARSSGKYMASATAQRVILGLQFGATAPCNNGAVAAMEVGGSSDNDAAWIQGVRRSE
jgi:hypothetical protein